MFDLNKPLEGAYKMSWGHAHGAGDLAAFLEVAVAPPWPHLGGWGGGIQMGRATACSLESGCLFRCWLSCHHSSSECIVPDGRGGTGWRQLVLRSGPEWASLSELARTALSLSLQDGRCGGEIQGPRVWVRVSLGPVDWWPFSSARLRQQRRSDVRRAGLSDSSLYTSRHACTSYERWEMSLFLWLSIQFPAMNRPFALAFSIQSGPLLFFIQNHSPQLCAHHSRACACPWLPWEWVHEGRTASYFEHSHPVPLVDIWFTQTKVGLPVSFAWWWFSHEVVSDSCDPMDYSPPGSSVHGILQGKNAKSGLPFPSPGDLPNPGIKPRNQTQVSCIVGRFFTNWTMREAPSSAYLLLLFNC